MMSCVWCSGPVPTRPVHTQEGYNSSSYVWVAGLDPATQRFDDRPVCSPHCEATPPGRSAVLMQQATVRGAVL